MDLLISFSWDHFYPMQREALRILRCLGDEQPHIEWTSVDGIAVAHTSLENRDVIRRCRELLHNKEEQSELAVKWLPVDYWCETSLAAMKQVLEAQVLPRIQTTESWGMIVKNVVGNVITWRISSRILHPASIAKLI
jgi:hypothetical protein